MDRLAKLDVDLLRAFGALLTEPNVTKAAKQLGVHQSTLSARLARLRSIFDDRLFVPSPSGRGVLVTPRALELQPRLIAVLSNLQEMIEPSDRFDPQTTDRVFTIALHENPAVMLTPDLVPRLKATAPHSRLSLLTPDLRQMPDLLESGKVDLFVGLSSMGDNAWRGRTLFDNGFLTGQRKGHPRGTGPFDLDQYCAYEHIIVSTDGGGFAGFMDDALKALGRTRRTAISIQSYSLAPVILAATDMLATLPRRFFERFGSSLDLFEPPLPLESLELVAYWHPLRQEDAGHKWLRGQLFAAAAVGRRAAPTEPRRSTAPGTAGRLT